MTGSPFIDSVVKSPSLFVIPLLFLLFLILSCQTESVSPYKTNSAPVIIGIDVTPDDEIKKYDTLEVVCNVFDEEGDSLSFNWRAEDGELIETAGPRTGWVIDKEGLSVIRITVSDDWHEVTVIDTVWAQADGGNGDGGESNEAPVIIRLEITSPDIVVVDDTVVVTCEAFDPDIPPDTLQYSWEVEAGTISKGGQEATMRWVTPGIEGIYTVTVSVSDEDTTVSKSLAVNVDTRSNVIYYSDFSTDQVTGRWSYAGKLANMGDLAGTYSIGWDSTEQVMKVSSRSDWATFAFRLNDRSFTDGIYRIKLQSSGTRISTLAFIPRLINASNYYLIGLDMMRGFWSVVSCVEDSSVTISGWTGFEAGIWHEVVYEQMDGDISVRVNGEILWSGELPEIFRAPLNIGVAVYGALDSQPAGFDELVITSP